MTLKDYLPTKTERHNISIAVVSSILASILVAHAFGAKQKWLNWVIVLTGTFLIALIYGMIILIEFLNDWFKQL